MLSSPWSKPWSGTGCRSWCLVHRVQSPGLELTVGVWTHAYTNLRSKFQSNISQDWLNLLIVYQEGLRIPGERFTIFLSICGENRIGIGLRETVVYVVIEEFDRIWIVYCWHFDWKCKMMKHCFAVETDVIEDSIVFFLFEVKLKGKLLCLSIREGVK